MFVPLLFNSLSLFPVSWLSCSPPTYFSYSWFLLWIGCPLLHLHFSLTGIAQHHQVSYWCSNLNTQEEMVRCWNESFFSQFIRLSMCALSNINKWDSILCSTCCWHLLSNLMSDISCRMMCLLGYMWKSSLLSKRCTFPTCWWSIVLE